MKRFIELNETDGYEAGSRCRRERVAGRLELLKAFFDGEPFWMVRLRGLKQADRDYLGFTGNSHWRFLDKGASEGKLVRFIPSDIEKFVNAHKIGSSR